MSLGDSGQQISLFLMVLANSVSICSGMRTLACGLCEAFCVWVNAVHAY